MTRGSSVVKVFCQMLELNKGMGYGISKSPHLTNTVCIEKAVRWRKPVIEATP